MKNIIYIIICFALITCSNDDSSTNSPDEKKFNIITPESPVDKGSRVFAINISESEKGFSESYSKARESGVEMQEIAFEWNQYELSKGEYVDKDNLFKALNFYVQEGIKVGVSLTVINTVKTTEPEYLNSKELDDSEYIEAFINYADWVLSSLPDGLQIPYVSIGNEIDLYLKGNDWQKFENFYLQVKSSLKSKYPSLIFSSKITVMQGILGSQAQYAKDHLKHCDVALFNYYPQGAGFQVMNPEIVIEHFDQVMQFTDLDVWFTEVGYQSGSQYCGSSEMKQAEFYHHFFTAWDNHNARIKRVVIDWLHDISDATLKVYEEYYDYSDPAFLEYLATLGVRNYDHTDKYAWLQIMEETKARGWHK